MIDIKDLFAQYNIILNDIQVSRFNLFQKLLVEWNERMNLTAITEYDEVVVKHFLDSCLIVNAVNMNEINSVADIGTGAGFPGIPLAILFPHIQFTLIDSLNKRIDFLEEVCTQLKLDNVDLIHGRSEDLGHSELRESYDLCVSRAVANLSTLLEYCIPFVSADGYFVSYKSEKSDDELASSQSALSTLNCVLSSRSDYELPIFTSSRSLLVFRKTDLLPEKYPRKAGIPSKKPL